MTKKNATYLVKVKGSDNWQYWRDVPPDCRENVKKKRWTKTLGTSVRSEALRRAREFAVEHDRIIAKIRYKPVLTAEEQARIDSEGGIDSYLRWQREQAVAAEKLRQDALDLKEWAAEGGDPDDTPDEGWARGAVAGMEAQAKAIGENLEREAALIEKVDQNQLLADALANLPHDVKRLTLKELLAEWVKARKPSNPDQVRVSVERFETLHGRLLLSQITKTHVREFRNHLAGSELMDSTASKRFRWVKTLLRWAVSDAYLDSNPGEGVEWQREKVKASAEKSRRSFTPAEVRNLLVLADKQSADVRWFMHLLAFTGARPEEIAQLAPDDITEVQGVLCIRIHDQGARTIKNRASLRDVPVHRALVDAGFLDFVAGRAGRELLFAVKPSKAGRLYTCLRQPIARLIRREIPDKRAKNYSFRDAFIDAMRRVEAPEDVSHQLVGHVARGREIHERYGRPQVIVLAKWMERIDPRLEAML